MERSKRIAAFLAGFRASENGYNGDNPCCDWTDEMVLEGCKDHGRLPLWITAEDLVLPTEPQKQSQLERMRQVEITSHGAAERRQRMEQRKK